MSLEALPAIELLEATHTFPCEYMFKVIGKVDRAFVARVVAAVREALVMEEDPPFRTRETPNGKHVAVTLTPTVRNPYDVLAVYRRVQGLPGVVTLF